MRAVLLPVLAGAVVNAVEKICYYPAVSAVALCCYSMVEPSIISAGQSANCPQKFVGRHLSMTRDNQEHFLMRTLLEIPLKV